MGDLHPDVEARNLEVLAESAHLQTTARIIREAANDIGMNSPKYADLLNALADKAETESDLVLEEE